MDKRFWVFSLGVTGGLALLCKNSLEAGVLLGVYLATIGNLLLLKYAVGQLLFGAKSSRGKVIIAFLGKMLLILGALILGVHFVGDRIVIAILNYIAQIFIFGLCLKRQWERA